MKCGGQQDTSQGDDGVFRLQYRAGSSVRAGFGNGNSRSGGFHRSGTGAFRYLLSGRKEIGNDYYYLTLK